LAMLADVSESGPSTVTLTRADAGIPVGELIPVLAGSSTGTRLISGRVKYVAQNYPASGRRGAPQGFGKDLLVRVQSTLDE